jgi:hypothetical protein
MRNQIESRMLARKRNKPATCSGAWKRGTSRSLNQRRVNRVADLASRGRLGFAMVVPQSRGRQEKHCYERNAGYDSPAGDRLRIGNEGHSVA